MFVNIANVAIHTQTHFNGHFLGNLVSWLTLKYTFLLVPDLCILSGQSTTFHILVNSILPCLPHASSLSNTSIVVSEPIIVIFILHISKAPQPVIHNYQIG